MRRRFGYSVMASVLVLLLVAWSEEPQKLTYNDGKYRCEYEVVNGLRHGTYISWYTNGTKRSEGSFQHNIRHGLWTVYDSTGRKRMVRDYKNNFEFELIFPKPSDEGPIPLLREPKYKLTYSSAGYIPYFYLEERAVAMSKRIWRFIPAQQGHPLFANSSFYHALIDSLSAGKIKAFNGYTDDEFRVRISEESILRLIDTSKYEVLGYNLKEDWFFDKDRMLSETRIIGIMPVCRSKTNEVDQIATAWFYFPTIRPMLAGQKVKVDNVPDYIHSLDDVFFFRYFHGTVYKESNYYDRTLQENVDNAVGLSLLEEQRRVEASLIEMEHDMWIYFSE